MEKQSLSRETLTHFLCKKCSKWWSISEAKENRKNWFCPWCGVVNTYDTDITKEKKQK